MRGRHDIVTTLLMTPSARKTSAARRVARLSAMAVVAWFVAVSPAWTQTPAAEPPAAAPETDVQVLMQIAGVGTLVDYAAIGRLLGAVEGVKRVDVSEAEGSTVTFRVTVRGGSAVIDRAFEGSTQLVRSPSLGGRLLYEYRH